MSGPNVPAGHAADAQMVGADALKAAAGAEALSNMADLPSVAHQSQDSLSPRSDPNTPSRADPKAGVQMCKKLRKKAADEEMVDVDALEAAAADVSISLSLQTSHTAWRTLKPKPSTALICCVAADPQQDAQEGFVGRRGDWGHWCPGGCCECWAYSLWPELSQSEFEIEFETWSHNETRAGVQMRKKMRKKAADEDMVDIDALEAAADAEAPSDHGSRRNARDQAAEAASARAEEMQKRRARCASPSFLTDSGSCLSSHFLV